MKCNYEACNPGSLCAVGLHMVERERPGGRSPVTLSICLPGAMREGSPGRDVDAVLLLSGLETRWAHPESWLVTRSPEKGRPCLGSPEGYPQPLFFPTCCRHVSRVGTLTFPRIILFPCWIKPGVHLKSGNQATGWTQASCRCS